MDVLARDRRLAVVKLRPGFEATYAGKPAVHAVAGAGEIVNWERLPPPRRRTSPQARGRGAGRVPGVTAPRIAAAGPPDGDLRQELLETLDADRRLGRVAAALEALV